MGRQVSLKKYWQGPRFHEAEEKGFFQGVNTKLFSEEILARAKIQ